MQNVHPKSLYNGLAVGIRDIPIVVFDALSRWIIDSVSAGARVVNFFGRPVDTGIRVYAVLSRDEEGLLYAACADVQDQYPSMTPACPAMHLFERELAEQWAVVPQGHPWLKPVRFHPAYRQGKDAWNRQENNPILPGVTDFFTFTGEEVHEVAVGPVHAGIIEPGHFRFQCHGENVLHLEISLGYQHRGIQQALMREPIKKFLHYMETLAGDTTVGHTLAYCQALEALSGCKVPTRAQIIRGIALELERLANHTGDLGALAGDIGYLPTASFCGRIRGDFLNITALLCGNRFGCGLIVPGGVGFDLESQRAVKLSEQLSKAFRDVTEAVNLLWVTPSVLARFENTGVVSDKICRQLGLVGVAARACGLPTDVRYNFPTGIYRFSHIPVSTADSGDVFARAYVRGLEIQRSVTFIQNQLEMLSEGPITSALPGFGEDRFVVSLIEGWRGRICHTAMTDLNGKICWYKAVDPSFFNWTGLAMAMRDQQISDFPLCNKSFNLSYCGYDL